MKMENLTSHLTSQTVPPWVAVVLIVFTNSLVQLFGGGPDTEKLSVVQKDVAVLQANMSTVKEDISELKADMKKLLERLPPPK